MLVVGEVQNGTADHGVHAPVGMRKLRDIGDGEVGGREGGSEARGELANDVDRGRLAIDTVTLEAMLQQVDEIAPVAAAGIEDARPRIKPAAQDLIEEIDVDVAELLPQFLAGRQLIQLLVVEDAGVCAGAGAPGRRGICSALNRGNRSSRIATWYTAAAITIADFFTSSSTTRS